MSLGSVAKQPPAPSGWLVLELVASLSDGAGDWKRLPSSSDEIRLAIGAAAARGTSVPRLVPSHVSPRGTAVARGSAVALGN